MTIQATYNVSDDKIKLDAGRRLTTEEYEQARAMGFQWWPGRKLLVAKWTPGREDFVLGLGCNLVHVEEEDDAEGRAERFEGYADNAATRSAEAYAKREAIQSMIPPGQPIIVGHHSERRHRGDIRRMDSYMAASISEDEKAEYWQRRATGALARAEKRESASAIAKRIKDLETDERKLVKATTPYKTLKRKDTGAICIMTDDGSTIEESVWLEQTERARRWLAHVRERLEYERALYAASGGTAVDRAAAEDVRPTVGGYVLVRGEWRRVEKVNPKTVWTKIVDGPCKGWGFKVAYEDIKGIKSADEYAAMKADSVASNA